MARKARKLSERGFYHIMFRGINHQNIFEEVSHIQKEVPKFLANFRVATKGKAMERQ